MTLKEIAKLFGMTVEQFATHIGYTRQALYQKTVNNPVRTQAIVRQLKEQNIRMLLSDLEAANQRADARLDAIEELRKNVLKAGER